MDNRTEIISKLKNRQISYQSIPKWLKNDEKIALTAIETYDGRVCEYIGDKLKNNKEFAKKVFNKKFGYALKYFSDNVKNDFTCCKSSIVDGLSGYTYIGEKLKNNKELALLEINQGYNIRIIPKGLRENQEIIDAYWNQIFKNLSYFKEFCSVLAIDDFGNSIIENFKRLEKERHTKSRIDEYEEKTETVQFIKFENGKLSKEIFSPILNPLIIIIGEQKNELSDMITNKYSNENNTFINIIEIYKKDVDTKNIKLITNNPKDILNLLRVITYTTAGDTWVPEDNLNDIKELLWKNKLENKNIEVKLFNNISDFKKVEKNFLTGKAYIIQLVSNNSNNNYNLVYYTDLLNEIQLLLSNAQVFQFHVHDSCNFENFEIYVLKLF